MAEWNINKDIVSTIILRVSEILSIFVVSNGRYAIGGHILRKCFSLLFLYGNVEVFSTRGQTNSTHLLCSYAAMHGLCIYPILSKCGALHRLFLYRSFHNLHINKRKSTPHFLCLYIPPYWSCMVSIRKRYAKGRSC